MFNAVNSGRGTLGKMVNDRALYQQSDLLVRELRSLVADVKKDPKRYFSVRVFQRRASGRRHREHTAPRRAQHPRGDRAHDQPLEEAVALRADGDEIALRLLRKGQ